MKVLFHRICASKYFWSTYTRYFSSGTDFKDQKISYRSATSDEPLVGWTIGNVLDRSAHLYGDKEAVVFCHQNIKKNFIQLKNDVDNLAAGFVHLGLKRGERIGIWCTNKYEWVLTQFAAAKAGLILVNINAAYRAKELEYCLNKVQISALVFDEAFKNQDYYEILQDLIPSISDTREIKSDRIPSLKYAISISPQALGGTYKFEEILQAGGNEEKNLVEQIQNKIQFDDPVNIIYTSGTTGNPKGATLTHHNVVNNAYFAGKTLGFHKRRQRVCLPLPLFHVFGSTVGSLNSLLSGSTVVYPSQTFDPHKVATAIHKERATFIMGTPTMFIDILNLPNFNEFDFTSLQTVLVGGAFCPEAVMKEIIEKMHAKQSLIGYGCTETSPCVTSSSPFDTLEHRITTIGPVMQHAEVKLVNDKNQIVPIGAKGELCVRSYQVMKGYWDDKEKTEEVITRDGWYKTGDLATMDENGYVRIVGRIKDLIIRGGENIYSKEVEDFLHTHQKIAEIQAVGVPDPRMGEEVCVWVKTRTGETLSEEDIKEFCKGNLASYKIPRYIIFVEDFPKTTTGKIQKYIMREESIKMLNLLQLK